MPAPSKPPCTPTLAGTARIWTREVGPVYACDELSGFVHAVALVRPGRVIHGLAPSSVRKKLKDKAFARTVNRDALTDVAPEIGLARG